MTIPFNELRKKWRKDPNYLKAYEELEPEFELARELIMARAKAGLSQEELARKMGTSQPTVARLESGHKPSLKTLERYAEAVGMKVDIRLVAGFSGTTSKRRRLITTNHIDSSGKKSMHATLSDLVDRLIDPALLETNVIPWASPVPSFGDLSRSRVATLGLNPSDHEFVDVERNELNDQFRRFHTLASLGLERWTDANKHHLELIIDCCQNYFFRNPYNRWFRPLDHLISGTKTSYYDASTQACHLDLIPYATACKWTELSTKQQSTLLELASDTLGLLLRDSSVCLLILNGQTVVNNFEEIAGIELSKEEMPKWTLLRRSGSGVMGYAYKGAVRKLAGVTLDREVLVLGFNHNIQGSRGVTETVKGEIRNWITHATGEANL